MGLSGSNDPVRDFPTEYEIPNYSKYAHRVTDDTDGRDLKNYEHNQRFEYFNLNVTGRNLHNYAGDVSLVNVVTTSKVNAPPPPEAPTIEQRGGLYFNHGYDAFKPTDIIAASGYENVDMDEVASALVHNQTFELKITAHADTSGDTAKNQTLSENRLNTAESLLIAALQRQGLNAEEAQALYDQRVAPHASIIAEGETNGPVKTDDGTRHQGNRVVTFDLITQGQVEIPEGDIRKGADPDNHEHIIMVNMGTTRNRSEFDLFPEYDVGRRDSNHYGIADEDVKCIFKISPDRNLNEAHQVTVNFWPRSNLTADNTTFLIESDQPGAVTSAYNFQTGKIDISLNGLIALSVATRNIIDPALIRLGQVTSDGHVTVSPLTNLDDVRPISEARRTVQENNPLTIAADRIVQLSVDAKHMFIEHQNDPAGYQAAIQEYGFAEKVEQALQDLTNRGVSTGPLQRLLVGQYANPESALYSPDQLFFPFQTYQGLYEAQLVRGNIQSVEPDKTYEALNRMLETSPTTEAGPPHSLREEPKSTPRLN